MKITFAWVGRLAAALLLSSAAEAVHLKSHSHGHQIATEEGSTGLMAAQTGTETDTEFLPMIILALEILQRDTVVCNQCHPADNKPKVHIVDLHERNFVRHHHTDKGDKIVVTGK